MRESKPVFYDEERLRWRRTRRVLEITGIVFTALLVIFFISVVKKPDLPNLIPDTRSGFHAIRQKLNGKVPARPGRKRRVAALGKVPEQYDPLRAAFYVNWDPSSLASLQNHYRDIDLLIAEQLHAVTPDGTLTVIDYITNQSQIVSPADAAKAVEADKLHIWMREQKEKEKEKGDKEKSELPIVMGLVNNADKDVWRTKEMAQFLANPAARKNLTQGLVQFAQLEHQAGIVFDFEDIPDESQPHFQRLVSETGAALHAAGLKLMIALPPRNLSFDYEVLAKHCDAIILMNYDQHFPASTPGPIAAQDWFQQNLEQRLKEIPPSKIVMAIANYAYDWERVPHAKRQKPAEPLSVQGALLRAHESETEVDFDSDSLNPHFSYTDENNRMHEVWMLDAVTAYNQLRASERAGVQGTALWRLGLADSSVWPIWDAKHPDDTARAKLGEIPPGPDLILEGSGEIWRITDTPKSGKRTFRYDSATDSIVDEDYEIYPLSYHIEQMGAVPKKIALTFDDGPDPEWTPKILDILEEKQAPATFFVIGEEASKNVGLFKRIVESGQEIGNHTFTHPPFEEASRTQVRFELNFCERLVEGTLGIKTTLFRPPYGIDQQPETADEVKMLPIPQEMGYLLIGSRIDPHDWGLPNGGLPPVELIVSEVLRQAPKGNIVLLHDGGGNRSHTVAALPQIIDQLRAQGYQLVAVSDLIGKTRAEVMIPITPQEQFAARADGFIFGLYHWFRLGIAYIFVLGIFLVSGRALIVGLLALVEKLRPDRAALPETPPVGILIPAHNEEDVIVETVEAALDSTYPNLEVIVVNDGSSDGTGDLLDRHFGTNPRVHIIHQENRGKSAALARALNETHSEIVVSIDADTAVESDAVSKLVRHFHDPGLGAIAGNIKVGNRMSWLTRWQALEYITSQNLEKRAFDLLNCITVVPGALGAWRVEAIRAAGGFTSDTVAEDTDLTIAIRRAGWRIGYDEEAIAWTQAPETAEALVRQRFRWTFGTLQSVWKHKDMLFRWKYGTLGWIALPNVFVFQLLLPLVSPLIDLMFLSSLILWGLAQLRITRIPQLWTGQDVERSLIFFAGFMLIDLLTCVIAFALEKKEDWALLWPVLLQRFYYRQMMYIVLFRSVMGAVQGHAVGWRGIEPQVPTPVAQA